MDQSWSLKENLYVRVYPHLWDCNSFFVHLQRLHSVLVSSAVSTEKFFPHFNSTSQWRRNVTEAVACLPLHLQRSERENPAVQLSRINVITSVNRLRPSLIYSLTCYRADQRKYTDE